MKITDKIKTAKKVSVTKSRKSFVSGGIIPDFLETEYFYNDICKEFYASVTFLKNAMGPPNHAHGGAIAAILDEAMGAAAWIQGLHSLTAKITIEYLHAVPVSKPFFVTITQKEISGRKIIQEGILIDADEKHYVRAESIFVLQDTEKLKTLGPLPEILFSFADQQVK